MMLLNMNHESSCQMVLPQMVSCNFVFPISVDSFQPYVSFYQLSIKNQWNELIHFGSMRFRNLPGTPNRYVFCMYFKPCTISRWTIKSIRILYWTPSLIVNTCFLSLDKSPVKSSSMSSRSGTHSANFFTITFRGSFASERMKWEICSIRIPCSIFHFFSYPTHQQ